MRIAMLMSVAYPPAEGIGYYVHNLSKQLVEMGHEIEIITRGKRGIPTHEKIDNIKIWRPHFLPLYPYHVHYHSLWVNKLVRSEFERRIDVFHIHAPLPPAINSSRAIMVTMHSNIAQAVKNTPVDDLRAVLINLQIPVTVRIIRKILNRASIVATVSQEVAETLSVFGATPANVAVLGNGVDVDLFRPYPEKVELDTIFGVGRLDNGKGYLDLIKSANLVIKERPQTKFKIAGDGPRRGVLEKKIKEFGLTEQVELIGHVAGRDNLIDLYNRAAIFVHPSHSEGMPTVVLEAMACGRPVVATSVGGVPDLIQNGDNGILVPQKSPEIMAKEILRLFTNQEALTRLGVNARKTIERSYSWETVAGRYINMYNQILEARPTHAA